MESNVRSQGVWDGENRSNSLPLLTVDTVTWEKKIVDEQSVTQIGSYNTLALLDVGGGGMEERAYGMNRLDLSWTFQALNAINVLRFESIIIVIPLVKC